MIKNIYTLFGRKRLFHCTNIYTLWDPNFLYFMGSGRLLHCVAEYLYSYFMELKTSPSLRCKHLRCKHLTEIITALQTSDCSLYPLQGYTIANFWLNSHNDPLQGYKIISLVFFDILSSVFFDILSLVFLDILSYTIILLKILIKFRIITGRVYKPACRS